jgi:hypothetical protein
MISDLLKTAIMSRINVKPSNNGWSKCNCPVCVLRGHNQDKKSRFGIKFSGDESLGIHCFNCAFKTKWEKGQLIGRPLVWFLQAIGINEEDLREIKFAAYRERENVKVIGAPTLSNIARTHWVPHKLPEGAKTINEWADEGCEDESFLAVAQYAIKRGLVDLTDLYWSPSTTMQMNKRVIIPYIYKNVIVGYAARYYKKPPNNFIPKYYSHTPENFIFNLDSQDDERKFVIVTEGTIDALVVSGIACLGNTINKTQVDIINSLNKTVILCPDRDSSGGESIQTAMDNGWLVSFPKWGEHIKDPAEAAETFGRILTVKTILDAVEDNPLKIHVSRKFDNYVG